MAIYINGITVEMFRNATLEAVEDLMAEGEMIDVLEPHGRLIDADALIDSLNIRSVTYNCVINKCIEDAPTVIERSDK